MSGAVTSSLLPSGYLSTSGGQIVDASGNPVRLESIAWEGAEGPAGNALYGLPTNNPSDPATAAAITTYLSKIAAEGFNTVRIPWSDVNLQDSLPVFQAIVADAGKLGLRIIFDHHDDDGHWGQQPNGLWFDTGPGTDGTDGAGDTGTVSAAQFQADTVALASAFAANPTVIGFDLDNEPLVMGAGTTASVNWGGGGPTDILAMYDTVGSAVEAADPGALIIAEGPESWTGTLLNGQPGIASDGDLSLAAAKPVTLTLNGLTVADKVVYSVHEYPSTSGNQPIDYGTALIQEMNTAWGYMEADNIAPVWIGEMGASLDDGGGADAASASQLATEESWAATILPYLNGADGAEGGPTVATGFSWWTTGNYPGYSPDGYNSGTNGSVNTGQLAVVSQLLTYSTPPDPPTSSPIRGAPDEFVVVSEPSGSGGWLNGTAYTGPVAGLTQELIYAGTQANLDITAYAPNSFIVGSSGTDAIDVSQADGNNVLEGGVGSNFLTGGTGDDTFFVDDRDPSGAIWSTIAGFHSGDSIALWGITAQDFVLQWADGQGAAGYTGLTLSAVSPGQPSIDVTLTGFTTADLSNGRLSISFGTTPNEPNLPGSSFMLIHGN